MLALLAGVAAADTVTAMVWLRPAVLHYGLIPLAGVLAYLAIVPLLKLVSEASKRNRSRAPVHDGHFSYGLGSASPPCLSLAGCSILHALLGEHRRD